MTKNQLLALHSIYPISVRALQHMLMHIGEIDNILTTSSSTIAALLRISQQQAYMIQQKYAQLRTKNFLVYYEQQRIDVVCYTEELYPSSLLAIYDAPTVLYGKGDMRLLQAPKRIACIGSRDATSYSTDVLKCLLPPLINEDYVIVSGLAKGADTFAHRGAIYYGGRTIAVLGHGFQTIYPASNKKLAQFMAEEHLLLTEYAPHMEPRKVHFPQRNRIICGLVSGLIITEAAEKSGTMITAGFALEQGKDIFVAPGPITSPLCIGTNKLIKEGAILVWNGYQILEEIQLFYTKN